MNILYLIDNLKQGGAQEIIYNLLNFIDRKRYNINICCLGSTGIFAERFAKLGVKIVYCDPCNPLNILEFINIIRQADLIHSHLFKSNVLGIVFAKLGGKKIIVHDHSGINQKVLSAYIKHKFFVYLYQRVFLFLLRFVDLITVITRNQGDYYAIEGINEDKILLLPNGIDTGFWEAYHRNKAALKEEVHKELAIPRDKRIIGMVARFSQEKGWEYFLQAAQMVLNRRQDVVFLAVGDGKTRMKCQSLAQELGIHGQIYFLGQRLDVPRLLCAFDIFVLASISEPFGIVVLEAMITGLPVIATNSGGPAEIITAGQNGYLTPSMDPRALAEKIDYVLDYGLADPVWDARVREYAIKNYDVHIILDKLTSCYDRLI